MGKINYNFGNENSLKAEISDQIFRINELIKKFQEDYMKEILSSSGKNAYKILYPNGIKDSNSFNGEEKKRK